MPVTGKWVSNPQGCILQTWGRDPPAGQETHVTFSVSSMLRNLAPSPTNRALLIMGIFSLTKFSMGIGATFSPPAVIRISGTKHGSVKVQQRQYRSLAPSRIRGDRG